MATRSPQQEIENFARLMGLQSLATANAVATAMPARAPDIATTAQERTFMVQNGHTTVTERSERSERSIWASDPVVRRVYIIALALLVLGVVGTGVFLCVYGYVNGRLSPTFPSDVLTVLLNWLTSAALGVGGVVTYAKAHASGRKVGGNK